jgi:hypothetical protein
MKFSKKTQVIADDNPNFSKKIIEKIIGKHVIVGYTYCRPDGSVTPLFLMSNTWIKLL